MQVWCRADRRCLGVWKAGYSWQRCHQAKGAVVERLVVERLQVVVDHCGPAVQQFKCKPPSCARMVKRMLIIEDFCLSMLLKRLQEIN